MLSEFKKGTDTATAVELSLGISPSEFDEGFNDFVEQEFGILLGQLDYWKNLHQTAMKQMSEGDLRGVIRSTEFAIEIFPDYVESDSPYIMQATAHSRLGDENSELDTLMRYWQRGGYAPEAIWLLARKLYHRGDLSQAIDALKSLTLVDPFDMELHGTLGDWMLEAGQSQDALTEFEIALAMKPHDLAEAFYRIAYAHHLLNQNEEARRNVLSALEIAPHFRPAQKLLLETTQTQQ
jgi:tetratricopeptide (TPR) repeat protein